MMYLNEQNHMPNDSMNIEKHTKTCILNTCVFKVNPGNQDSLIIFTTVTNISLNGSFLLEKL
jgi:hypothetical protein